MAWKKELDAPPGRECLRAGEAFAVRFLIVDGEGGERAVDEIDDAGFAGAGRFVGGNDARGDGVDFDGFLGREELEFPWGRRLGGLVRVLRGGDDGRPVRGEPNGADGGTAAREKITTAKIVDHKRGQN